jgi:hypothetical protein
MFALITFHQTKRHKSDIVLRLSGSFVGSVGLLICRVRWQEENLALLGSHFPVKEFFELLFDLFADTSFIRLGSHALS